MGRLSKDIRSYFLISNISLLSRAICSLILQRIDGHLFFHALIWASMHNVKYVYFISIIRCFGLQLLTNLTISPFHCKVSYTSLVVQTSIYSARFFHLSSNMLPFGQQLLTKISLRMTMSLLDETYKLTCNL